jgi:hypothetical protein
MNHSRIITAQASTQNSVIATDRTRLFVQDWGTAVLSYLWPPGPSIQMCGAAISQR